MSDRPTLWDWTKAVCLYAWMWMKGLPILYIPFFTRLVTDEDKEVADIQRDLATLRRLLKAD